MSLNKYRNGELIKIADNGSFNSVTGVKGDSETSYRTGNINITKDNIGLGNVGNFKAVSTVASQGLTTTEQSNARANIGAGTSNLTIGITSTTALAGDTKYAGSSTVGGAATSAEKLTNTSKIGDTNKPVYFKADGTPTAISYTIDKSVPSNAVFTDTTYESKTAASGGTAVSLVTTGEKYTWNNKSSLTIGTTASTAAAGNHTHGLSLATDTGTSSISLAANTKYKLTAGGSTYVFTTPPDNNTTTGTTYTAGNVPANTTFATNGSVKNAYDALNSNLLPSSAQLETSFVMSNDTFISIFFPLHRADLYALNGYVQTGKLGISSTGSWSPDLFSIEYHKSGIYMYTSNSDFKYLNNQLGGGVLWAKVNVNKQ